LGWSGAKQHPTGCRADCSVNQKIYLSQFIVDSDNPIIHVYSLPSLNGETITCYPDADNDLYPGVGSESVASCSTGYYVWSHFTSMLVADCNDNNAAIHPGNVPDICMNGIDENCDGADSPINTCSTSGLCTAAGGYWYGTPTASCHADPYVENPSCDAAHPSLCLTQGACEATTPPRNWCSGACQTDPCPTASTYQVRQSTGTIRQGTGTVQQVH
jgi:hypothetical protein